MLYIENFRENSKYLISRTTLIIKQPLQQNLPLILSCLAIT